MKVKAITRERAYAKCDYHIDNHPSVVINLTGPYEGKWYCFSCKRAGIVSGRKLKQLKKKGAMKAPNASNGGVLPPSTGLPLSRAKKLSFEYQRLAKRGKLKELADSWNVSENVLEQFEIGWDGRAFTIPMKREGKIVGIQRRFPTGAKCSVPGSRPGLFIPKGLELKDTIYITEGASDAVVVRHFGLPCIGRPTAYAQLFLVKEWMTKFIKNIIILSDNDIPGRDSSQLLKSILIGNVEIRVPPYKDVREYYKNDANGCFAWIWSG